MEYAYWTEFLPFRQVKTIIILLPYICNAMVLLNILGLQEIIIIALVVLLFFGATRIPALMRSLGQGVKSFKAGMNDPVEEPKKEEEKKDNPE